MFQGTNNGSSHVEILDLTVAFSCNSLDSGSLKSRLFDVHEASTRACRERESERERERARGPRRDWGGGVRTSRYGTTRTRGS